jgi:integrase
LFSWLLLLKEISKNPVPRGLSTRRQAVRCNGVPLIRTPKTLPQVLEPTEVDALLKVLHRWRDRAMVEAMLLGGLRRCEALGLRMASIRAKGQQSHCRSLRTTRAIATATSPASTSSRTETGNRR